MNRALDSRWKSTTPKPRLHRPKKTVDITISLLYCAYMKCRKCKSDFIPTQHQIKKHNWICSSCNGAYLIEYRKKRAADGNPVKGGNTSPARKKAYSKEYSSRPEVKKNNCVKMKRYRNDPRLRMKHEARWQAGHAVTSGKIKKSPCSKCGNPKSEMHHPDYYKPLDVLWLCRACHIQEHRRKAREEMEIA